jgi:hypothetical protein
MSYVRLELESTRAHIAASCRTRSVKVGVGALSRHAPGIQTVKGPWIVGLRTTDRPAEPKTFCQQRL